MRASAFMPSTRKPLIYCNFGFTWVLSPPSSSCDGRTKALRLVIQARPTMLIEVNGERTANTEPDFAEIFRTQSSCKHPCSLYTSPFPNSTLLYCMSCCVNVSNSEYAYLTGNRTQVTTARGFFHPLVGSCPSSEIASRMNYASQHTPRRKLYI